MKIGLFSDVHYCQSENLGLGRNPALALERVKEAMQAFKDAGVENCFCLGDLTDHAQGDTKQDALRNFRHCVSIIHGFGIPFNLVIGNHDCLMMTREEIENEYAKFDSGKLLASYGRTNDSASGDFEYIALDANYRSDMRHFEVAGVKWDDANLPQDELDMLDKRLSEATLPCIVFIHENLDPSVDNSHIVKNADKARKIISRHKEKVRAVIQGHYHRGSYIEIDGIPYITLSAMCEGDKNPYMILEV